MSLSLKRPKRPFWTVAVAIVLLVSAGCGGEIDEEVWDEDVSTDELSYGESSGDRGAFTHIPCNGAPNAPDWFYRRLDDAAQWMPHVPDAWGDRSNSQALALARIVRRESDFRYHVVGASGTYVGMFQINRSYFPIGDCTYGCYWNGCKDRQGKWRPPTFWQIVAGLRYILGRYGTPAAAWQHHCSHNWY